MLEVPLLDPTASPVAAAQEAALAEAIGINRLLCHRVFVRTAAEAISGARTQVFAVLCPDCPAPATRTPAGVAARARDLIGRGPPVLS